MLFNRAYIGEAVHKGDSYPGKHEAIIDRGLGDKVHLILKESPRAGQHRTRAQTPALLKGLVYGPDGAAFSPTHTRKHGRLYRYYVSQSVLKFGKGACPIGQVPAGVLEAGLVQQLRTMFRQPAIIVRTWKAARTDDASFTEVDSTEAFLRLDPLWDKLFPVDQARIVGLMVERVEIGEEGLNVQIRVDALGGLARELLSKVGDAVCNGSVLHKPLTFPHHVQPWRDSPNKEINLIPNLKLPPTRTDKQESTRH